jgi:hypothetical protein
MISLTSKIISIISNIEGLELMFLYSDSCEAFSNSNGLANAREEKISQLSLSLRRTSECEQLSYAGR